MSDLVERIESEAAIASRPGQSDRLAGIAAEVDALEERLAEAESNALWFRQQADHHIGRANRLEQANGAVSAKRQADVWAECVAQAEACGWLHDFAADDMAGRNPYAERDGRP